MTCSWFDRYCSPQSCAPPSRPPLTQTLRLPQLRHPCTSQDSHNNSRVDGAIVKCCHHHTRTWLFWSLSPCPFKRMPGWHTTMCLLAELDDNACEWTCRSSSHLWNQPQPKLPCTTFVVPLKQRSRRKNRENKSLPNVFVPAENEKKMTHLEGKDIFIL